MKARKASVGFIYKNRDISTDISDYIISFRYTDHSHGKLDDIELKLEDSGGLWLGEWFPSKGARVEAYIHTENWDKPDSKKKMRCGSFLIDEVSYSGMPDTITLRGVSAVVGTGLRQQKNSKAWENIKLKGIAEEIASSHGLQVYWESKMNMGKDRYDQRDESDLAFLKRELDEVGFSLKVAEEKLIIFFEEDFEKRSAVLKFSRDGISNYSFRSKSQGVYSSCLVSYSDPEAKAVNEYLYTPDNAPEGGQTLKINRRVKSQSEAEEVAKSALYKANKFETTASFSSIGNPDLRASFIAEFEDCGHFSGRYFVDKVTHSISSGKYVTGVEAHKL